MVALCPRAVGAFRGDSANAFALGKSGHAVAKAITCPPRAAGHNGADQWAAEGPLLLSSPKPPCKEDDGAHVPGESGFGSPLTSHSPGARKRLTSFTAHGSLSLTYASTGHLPILARDIDGTVHRATEPVGHRRRRGCTGACPRWHRGTPDIIYDRLIRAWVLMPTTTTSQ